MLKQEDNRVIVKSNAVVPFSWDNTKETVDWDVLWQTQIQADSSLNNCVTKAKPHMCTACGK